jgi:beta-glucosidase
MTFRADFVWGAASSAYQVEGGWLADGKGPSTWDQFSHEAGNVYMGHTGDVGCDHFTRYREDVALMGEMGLRAYRFSISWPRVEPGATGEVNRAGLGFYDRLVDELLSRGITPWVTLFHWDLPLWCYHKGGWLNRDIAGWFARYAEAVVGVLGDRVTHWMTLNEPHIFLGPSEHEGIQTSNAKKSHVERLWAAHNCLMAHGRGAMAIREVSRRPCQVGWAPIGRCKTPATDRPEDIEAARRATHAVTAKDFWNNAWLADPVVLGHYPEDGMRLYHDDLVKAGDAGMTRRALTDAADLAVIRQPLDFYGINVYDAERMTMAADGTIKKVDFPPGHARNALGWFVEPTALYFGPRFLYERYGVPIVVTENGMSSHDWVDLDGRVRDPQRIDYTRRYLRELRRASGDGTDIRGYFHWSVMDNFEWQSGYKERFGLIHVDYTTGARTLKDSARWYRGVIESNGAALDVPLG